MLQAAIRAVAAGFHVFPVVPGGKVPHQTAGSWGQTATRDLNQVVRFWTQVEPKANVGIACKLSEILVVDLDLAKEAWNLRNTPWAYLHEGYGDFVSGEDVFREMHYRSKGSPDDLDTYAVRTGSGGLHLYYRWYSYFPKTSQASPVRALIDVRGNGGTWGGYVLGAGSVTGSGPYVGNSSPIKEAPPWIAQMVIERPRPPQISKPRGLRQPGAISYSGLVESVQKAGEGNRNNALLWAARAMCSDGAPQEEALSTLAPAAFDSGLGVHEIETTIRSAYRLQSQKEGGA